MLKQSINGTFFKQLLDDEPVGGAPAGDSGDDGKGGTDNGGTDEELVEYEGYKIPVKLKEKISKRVVAEKGRVEKDLSEKLSENESKYVELENQFKELKKASMTDKERTEQEQREREEELEKLKAGKEQAWGLFKQTKRDNDIYSALADYDVYSPRQVVRLIEAYGDVDVIEKNGKHETVVKLDGEQLDVKSALKKFFEDTENANLLKNNLRPGAGSSNGKSGGVGVTRFSKSEMEKNTTSAVEMRKAYAEAVKMYEEGQGDMPVLYD